MTGFLKQVWLVLLLAVVLGGGLAFVDRSLQGRIASNAQQRLERAVFAVVPRGTASDEQTLAGRTVYRVTNETGLLAGWAVPAETMGFVDKLKLLIGLSADGSEILGLAVLESKETPGLGERIRDEDFRRQFKGMPTGTRLEVVKASQSADHPVHAVTGATISSKAVTEAVNKELARVLDAIRARDREDDSPVAAKRAAGLPPNALRGKRVFHGSQPRRLGRANTNTDARTI